MYSKAFAVCVSISEEDAFQTMWSMVAVVLYNKPTWFVLNDKGKIDVSSEDPKPECTFTFRVPLNAPLTLATFV